MIHGQLDFDFSPLCLASSNLKQSQIGLSASTIASSFGKAISDKKELEDYRPEDISLSLLRMISYNIGQVN